MILESCKISLSDGWLITPKTFCDPSKKRIDPIAALWYNNVFISKEISDAFYSGFIDENIYPCTTNLIEFKNLGTELKLLFRRKR